MNDLDRIKITFKDKAEVELCVPKADPTKCIEDNLVRLGRTTNDIQGIDLLTY